MILFEKSKYYTDDCPSDMRFGLSGIVLRALNARGFKEPAQIKSFLNPSIRDFYDPFLLPDMDKAVERIKFAIENSERICVFGDYDVDGICSTAMLVRCLERLNADCIYHIPLRKEEGYGMSSSAVKKLAEQNVKLIITVDNGISAIDEIAACYDLGIDVIVTDHHIPSERLPKCEAVVCHTVSHSHYPAATLCGAGIAFKLIHALIGLEGAMEYVDLAALATVADVVPLTGENRIIVKFGLDALNRGACVPGLNRMLNSIPGLHRPFDSFSVGFTIAPRLNASGRMSDASLGVKLLLTDDTSLMDEIIRELENLNTKRKAEEANILSSAVTMLDGVNLSNVRIIALKSEKWNPGVIGVAASRISEMFYRPVILFSESDGMLKGSARSIDGINIHSALSKHSHLFERFGGHAKAAGINMSADKFDKFKSELELSLGQDYDNSLFIPRKRYEFDITLNEVNINLVRELERLAPFGEGNPSPIFRAKNLVASDVRRFGAKQQHVRLNVSDNGVDSFESVWFSGGVNFERLICGDTLDMIFTIEQNRRAYGDPLQFRVIAANNELPTDIDACMENAMPRFCSAFIENNCYNRKNPMLNNEVVPIDIAKMSEENLAGLLILAFSPSAAADAIAQIKKNNAVNIDVCYTQMVESAKHTNTLIIAPMIYLLPKSGYDKIVFYDVPCNEGVYSTVRSLYPNAVFYFNIKKFDGFGSVAKRFDCRREFLGSTFKNIEAKLKIRPYSYAELIERCADEMGVSNYLIEFAVAVFFELDFIRCDENCAIVNSPEIKCRRLAESPLYSEILNLSNFDK